jgi:hypothetical protein
MMIIIFWEMTPLALIRTDVSEDCIASIFRVHECKQVTERSCKLLYRHKLVGVISQKMIMISVYLSRFKAYFILGCKCAYSYVRLDI